jgi:hypothetical protein
MRRLLFQVFGKQVALLFGGVCFLSVAVLSTLYLTSSYALKLYVEEQIGKLPWDVYALQRSQMATYAHFQQEYRSKPGIVSVEALGFVRIQRGNGRIGFEIDGVPLPARWIGVIGTSEPIILPAELRQPAAGNRSIVPPAGGLLHVRTALVAPNGADAALPRFVRSGARLRLYANTGPGGHEHSHGADVHPHDAAKTETVFEAIVANDPAQMERQEFNKWLLRNVGSLSFLPEQSVVIAVPMPVFERLAATFDDVFADTDNGTHGVHGPPQYLPELSHLLKLDRAEWISPWDLKRSIQDLTPLLKSMLADLQNTTAHGTVSSDLYQVISRMQEISDLIGIVSVIVAIPLLWLAWVVAKLVSRLVLLNARRSIGLTLIRGVPIRRVRGVLMLALVVGGLAGGLLGLLAGTLLPLAAHRVAGHGMPPVSVISQGVIYFAGFLAVGLALGLLSAREMARAVRGIAPREAIARVEPHPPGPGFLYLAAVLVALVLGTYKVVSWSLGRSLLIGALQGAAPDEVLQIIAVSEMLLNFVGIPLFLFGVTGLLRLRLNLMSYCMTAVMAPFVGRLRWFISEHMTLAPYRTSATMFATALAVALALSPQIASDTFEGRVLRGVRASVGGDIQLEFDLVSMAGGRNEPAPVYAYYEEVAAQLASIEDALRANPAVTNVGSLQQYLIPSFYLPTQSALMLDLVEAPQEYSKAVYYEEGLGRSAPFSRIIDRLPDPELTASAGLLRVREIPRDRDVIFGYDDSDASIQGRFRDAVALLPGQPSISVAQREGYAAAELDYLNHTFSTDARIIEALETFEKGPLAALKVLPSKAVFVVRTSEPVNDATIERLLASIPTQPQSVRSVPGERERISADMFVSLALANMKVFMIGGLVMAVFGVIVVGITNFIAERRTFSLLRLRGLPWGLLIRISLGMFLVPVLIGVLLGGALGTLAGYGLAEAIWEVPRVYGVAGFLGNSLAVSPAAVGIVAVFAVILSIAAGVFAFWPLRNSAREAMNNA